MSGEADDDVLTCFAGDVDGGGSGGDDFAGGDGHASVVDFVDGGDEDFGGIGSAVAALGDGFSVDQDFAVEGDEFFGLPVGDFGADDQGLVADAVGGHAGHAWVAAVEAAVGGFDDDVGV